VHDSCQPRGIGTLCPQNPPNLSIFLDCRVCKNKVTKLHVFYFHRGDCFRSGLCVCVCVCVSVCVSVCLCAKYLRKVMNGFSWNFWRDGCNPRNNRLDFGGNADRDRDPGIFLKNSLFTNRQNKAWHPRRRSALYRVLSSFQKWSFCF